MGVNSTATAYNFGQLGSAYMAVSHGSDLTPPDGMVIVAITMVGDDIKFDKLTADTSNSVVYGGTESNNVYFGIANANTGGNGEAVVADGTPVFPAGLTIYGRWTVVSLQTADADGGIICYFGY
tara:strand:+ start:128 stop:499 length:372 start_codon:yes stop_codon:yes gene_type:complete